MSKFCQNCGMAANDNAARIFLRFLSLVQKDCRRQRDVAYYADLLFITSKYLSQVSRTVSGLPASQWISFYTIFYEGDVAANSYGTIFAFDYVSA